MGEPEGRRGELDEGVLRRSTSLPDMLTACSSTLGEDGTDDAVKEARGD